MEPGVFHVQVTKAHRLGQQGAADADKTWTVQYDHRQLEGSAVGQMQLRCTARVNHYTVRATVHNIGPSGMEAALLP